MKIVYFYLRLEAFRKKSCIFVSMVEYAYVVKRPDDGCISQQVVQNA